MRTITRVLSTTSDAIARRLSRKQWQHREQLHTLNESERYFFAKVRWQIAVLAMLGLTVAFAIRCNFGVAKARMLSNFTDAWGAVHAQEFYWSTNELGLMESAFFYGYAASQIPAGMLAAKLPPHLLYGFGIFSASVLNMLIPMALSFHPTLDKLVVVLQVVQGLALGLLYPALQGVWRHWAPPMERSKLITTSFAGVYLGMVVGFPGSAALVSYVQWWAPFYTTGAIGIVWTAIWLICASSSPTKHRWIRDEERVFITEQIGQVATHDMTLSTVPWKSIFTSLPNWSVCVCNFARNWVFFMLLVHQMSYFKEALGIDIQKSGAISSVPQCLTFICLLMTGQLADYLCSTGKLSTVATRKLFMGIGFFSEGALYAVLAFTQDPTIAVALLIVATGFAGIASASLNVNFFDIAPRYAPILVGISNGIGSLAGAGSFITEHLTLNNPGGWRYCFLLATAIDCGAALFFVIFARGEVQDWAKEVEPEAEAVAFGDLVRQVSLIVRRSVSVRGMKRNGTRRRSDEIVLEGAAGNGGQGVAAVSATSASANVPDRPEV